MNSFGEAGWQWQGADPGQLDVADELIDICQKGRYSPVVPKPKAVLLAMAMQ